MERQRNVCTTCGRFMSISRISKGGTICISFFWGAFGAVVLRDQQTRLQASSLKLRASSCTLPVVAQPHTVILVVLLMAQAQCNRCGAPLANRGTRSLKVHRLHCSKSKPMKFIQPDARMSRKAAAQLSNSRRPFSRDEVHLIIFHTML